MPVLRHLLLGQIVEIGFVLPKEFATFEEGKNAHKDTDAHKSDETESHQLEVIFHTGFHDHEECIVRAMEKDWDDEDTCHVPIFHHVVLMAAEMDERIIIAHRHRKHEMSRYRENASCDADRHHIFLID